MFHETSKSHSLIKQTGLNRNFLLWSSTGLYTPSNLLSSWVLSELRGNESGLFLNHSAQIKVEHSFCVTMIDGMK